MANCNLSVGDVRATVDALELSKRAENSKAVQKGTRFGEKSSGGDEKESSWKRKGGKE